VDRETFSGSLGYGDSRSVVNWLSGTITRLPAEGAVMRRGAILFRVDNSPVVLMYGSVPAYRALESGVSDGPDVEQLERNLRDMGYDPDGTMTVDGDFDADTADAVERWQEDLGLEETGVVERGRVVFMPGARRVATIQATLGPRAGPGTPIMATTGTVRSMTVDLDARRQDLVHVGAKEQVELPDGATVDATVTEIGTVAKAASEDENPSVTVTLTLDGTKGVTRIDGAPVDVHIAKEERTDALSVPVTALLALAGGGYGLEVVEGDGSHRIVAVEPGLYADGYVEVSGHGIASGTRVVTAT
jgi:peptidoglycan hydrolase-like protein with peptidoglycan-binding domain